MNSPEITAAKMICKSIDALTREIHLLRKDVLDGRKLKAEMRELDVEADQTPLAMNRRFISYLLAGGRCFHL